MPTPASSPPGLPTPPATGALTFPKPRPLARDRACARSTEEVRGGLTWRGSVRLGGGGPWFCPEVGPVAGVCRGIHDLLPDPGDPKMPEGAHLSSCSLGSLSSNLSTSKDPVPPALWGTQENRLPPSSPQGPNHSPLECTRFWDPRPLLCLQYRKLDPHPNRGPRMKILGLLPPAGLQGLGS